MRATATVAAIATAIACGGLDATTAGAATLADPAGDTLGIGTPQHDLVAISAETLDGTLRIALLFSATVPAPDGSNPAALAGLIDIDTDHSTATGRPSLAGWLCPADSAVGPDFTIDLFGAANGVAPVVDAQGANAGSAAIAFSGTRVDIAVPASIWGGPRPVDVLAAVGTRAEITDCAGIDAPLTANVRTSGAGGPGGASAIPALGDDALAMLAALVAAAAALSRRRDRGRTRERMR